MGVGIVVDPGPLEGVAVALPRCRFCESWWAGDKPTRFENSQATAGGSGVR